MISLLIWCSSHLQGKQFPITLNKQLSSTCTFPFKNLSSHCVIGYQFVQPCTCKEYSKNIQFMTTSPYYNPTTYTGCESLRSTYFAAASHLTIVKKTSTNHITNLYCFSSSACPYQGYGQSNGYIFNQTV